MGKASIHDVARRAGVSITTVSFVLNGKEGISEATRRRVEQAAGDLGYVGNPHARSLVTGRSMTIVAQISGVSPDVVIPTSHFFAAALNGAAEEALRRGWAVVVAPPASGPELAGLSVDGALIVDPVGGEPLLQLMRDRDAPTTTIGRYATRPAERIPWVDNDHRLGTRTLLDELERCGYRRPALLAPRADASYSVDSVDAYREWCAERSVPAVVRRFVDPGLGDVEDVALTLLRRRARPDAIVVAGDEPALGVLRAARGERIRVPEDLGLAATADSPALQLADPAITALDLHVVELGRAAVRQLLGIIESGESTADGAAVVTVPFELMRRRSSAGAA